MVNKNLAQVMRLSDEEVSHIEDFHEKLKHFLSEDIVSFGFGEIVYRYIEDCEYLLQKYWGFPQDPSKHTWKLLYKFKCKWYGRKFKCITTGVEFTIPATVREKDFYTVGEGFVDVGVLDGYCRLSNVVEINGD